MNLTEWWRKLPWDSDKEHMKNCTVCKANGRRCKPLSWVDVFFRDKKAVILNFGTIAVLLIALGVRLIG